MKPIQIVIGAVALAAAGGAGFVMMNLNNKPPQVVETVKKVATKKVLVAKKQVPMGNKLTSSNIGWQEWPESGIKKGFITSETNPKGVTDFSKAIARMTFYEGEPIREAKVVRSDSGYMSAILPSGKRAVALKVAAASGAGGFILPNDYVDVILVTQTRSAGSGARGYLSDVILSNVRVLAIDQVIEDKKGKKAKVGKTATLELTPGQSETLAIANKGKGQLTLALRSIQDSGPKGDAQVAKQKREQGGNISLIRYGVKAVTKAKN